MDKKYMLIRGARVANQLEEYLAESSYADLERNTLNYAPASKKRQHATNPVQIRQLELVPYQGALGVNGSVNSVESNTQYQPQMMFLNVEYVDAEQLNQQPEQEQPEQDTEQLQRNIDQLDQAEDQKNLRQESVENDPNTVTFKAADGKDYTIMPISLAKNNVKVRCTCLDFRWRFAMYNDKDGSLFGAGPGLYQKKTDRPPNNPQQVPGLCKHLLKLAAELKTNGVVGP